MNKNKLHNLVRDENYLSNRLDSGKKKRKRRGKNVNKSDRVKLKNYVVRVNEIVKPIYGTYSVALKRSLEGKYSHKNGDNSFWCFYIKRKFSNKGQNNKKNESKLKMLNHELKFHCEEISKKLSSVEKEITNVSLYLNWAIKLLT